MTLKIELSGEQESVKAGKARPHISEIIVENMRDMPEDVLSALPKDGASQHDHYIYGLPKSDQ